MISVMRKYLKGLHFLLFGVIAVFIATSVFVFGSNRFGGGGTDGVAVVNGEKIPVERYQRFYQAFVNQYRQRYPDRFTPEMADRLGLRQQVMNELVLEAVILQQARAEGFSVSDEELSGQIQAVPAFQQNGTFSVKLYEEFLRQRRTTPAAFETDVRRDLLRFKAESAIRSGTKVSDAEVEQEFRYRKERVRAAWALVDMTGLMARVSASDEEVQAFLKDHSAQFQRPVRRRIQYVLADSSAGLPTIPDAEVEKYYTEHPAEFEMPRQVQAAHILVRVPETGGSEGEAKARAKVEDVIRRAKAGEDFAKLAREVSEDPGTASKGGDLGWVAKGQLVPAFDQALLPLKKGQVTEAPVRTQYGYHAIKAFDVREGGKKTLKDATASIRAKLLTARLENAASAKAEEARKTLVTAKDFVAEAKRLGLPVRESIVSRSTGARGQERSDAIQEAAFGLAIGGVSPPVKTPAGVVVLKVVDELPAGVPPLADIKVDVENAVKRQKAEAQALEIARKLVADARGGDLVPLARKAGVTTGETPFFSRLQPNDRLPGEAMMAVFQTPVGAISEPVKTPQGYYVVKTLERTAPDSGELAKEREQTARELLDGKQTLAWQSWVLAARQKAKVELSDRVALGS